MIRAREESRRRVRRIIYNDDGCGPCFSAEGATPDGFLNGPTARMSAVPGTQADSVFINSGATHVLTHPSAVAETYADVIERYGIKESMETVRDTLRSLFAAGTDPVRLTVDFCGKHGIEVFYSYRVNDLHLAQGGDMEAERSTWWRERPEYWLGAAARIREEDAVVYLPIADDIAAAARDGRLDSAVLKVQVSGAGTADGIEVGLNGTLLTPSMKEGEEGWLTFQPEPSLYRVGENTLAIRGARPAGGVGIPAQLTGVEVHVRYRR